MDLKNPEIFYSENGYSFSAPLFPDIEGEHVIKSLGGVENFLEALLHMQPERYSEFLEQISRRYGALINIDTQDYTHIPPTTRIRDKNLAFIEAIPVVICGSLETILQNLSQGARTAFLRLPLNRIYNLAAKIESKDWMEPETHQDLTEYLDAAYQDYCEDLHNAVIPDIEKICIDMPEMFLHLALANRYRGDIEKMLKYFRLCYIAKVTDLTDDELFMFESFVIDDEPLNRIKILPSEFARAKVSEILKQLGIESQMDAEDQESSIELEIDRETFEKDRKNFQEAYDYAKQGEMRILSYVLS